MCLLVLNILKDATHSARHNLRNAGQMLRWKSLYWIGLHGGFCLFCSTHGNDKMIYPVAKMMRSIGAIVLVCGTLLAAPQPPVTFESPCDCQGNHGEHRWSVKVDPSTPPTDARIQSVTPSDVYGWPGMDVHLTWQSERTGIENNWYALTGRVVAVKVEADDSSDVPKPD
jgi:hypothetical protein